MIKKNRDDFRHFVTSQVQLSGFTLVWLVGWLVGWLESFKYLIPQKFNCSHFYLPDPAVYKCLISGGKVNTNRA